MKKKMDVSVFARYFISYLGVALFFCAVLGLVIFGISVRELNSAAKKEQADKLLLASKDLQNQFQVMRNMSYIIQTTYCYNKVYLEQDSYNEIELLEDFKKFENYSLLADDYFLLYHDSDWIFKSGSKTTVSLFAADSVGVNKADDLYNQLNQIDKFTVLTPNGANNIILVAMPIYPSGLTGTGSEATLCFAIKKQTLINRITNVAGDFAGKLQIYYQNKFMSGEVEKTGNISSLVFNKSRICDRKGLLAACSPDKSIGITLDIPLGVVYDRMGYFRLIGIVLLTVFALVSVVLAWFASYRNYKPIQKLVKKYRAMRLVKAEWMKFNNWMQSFYRLLKQAKQHRRK